MHLQIPEAGVQAISTWRTNSVGGWQRTCFVIVRIRVSHGHSAAIRRWLEIALVADPDQANGRLSCSLRACPVLRARDTYLRPSQGIR